MLAALRGWVIRHQPPSEAVSLTARYDTPTKINHLSPRRAGFLDSHLCERLVSEGRGPACRRCRRAEKSA